MRITLLAVGRVRGELAAAVEAYEARARHYWKLEVVEVDEGGPGEPDRVKAAEEERILSRVPERSELVALTRDGKGMTSRGLARWLERLGVTASAGPCFALGGAFGLGEGVLARAAIRLTLSPMTLPHEMARLVLAEQLYRAGTIVRGEPYHKERIR